MTNIEVLTGARLHFGLLCGKPDSSWHYGGIGMMVSEPAWQIQLGFASNSGTDEISGTDAARHRVTGLLTQFREQFSDIGPIMCSIRREAGFHSGLGSGTQLTLAVACGLLLLSGRPMPSDNSELASQLGRSQRSAIGTFGFEQGGFLIDRGRNGDHTQACVEKHRFPDTWRMVLIRPIKTQGLYGQQEEHFFDAADYLDDTTLNRLVDVIRTGIEPAVDGENYELFIESLALYGHLIGEYYSGEQGGTYSSAVIRDLVPWIKSEGLPIPVQSSWGPTVCLPARSDKHAEELVQILSRKMDTAVTDISVTRGMNAGATIRSQAPEGHHRSFG